MNQLKTPEHMRQETRRDPNGMKPFAERLHRHYTMPTPETAVPQPFPFPRRLWLGLWTGVIVGTVSGLLFARLLFTGVIIPGGWEAIFSLGPFTFHFFWTMLGLSLGMMLSGVMTIHTTKVPK